MTGPEDTTSTRPISVAELLAKNGTIGAPPVGGRRRRRRGNSDAVTVAELTGEIPVIADDTEIPTGREAAPAPEAAPQPAAPEPAEEPAASEQTDPDLRTDAEADYDAHVAAREADPEPVEFRPRSRRPQAKRPVREYEPSGTGAERMIPDPLDEPDDEPVGLVEPADHDDDDAARAVYDDYQGGSYSSLGPLFGGQTMADDLARRDADTDFDDEDIADEGVEHDEDGDAAEHDEYDDEAAAEGSPLVRGLWIVGQCVVAVAFGAGLFVAFDQLWKWNTIVALVLGVLVILGLAGGVRVVRKTEDIGSTLTAVAVGSLVTFGPLALLQAS